MGLLSRIFKKSNPVKEEARLRVENYQKALHYLQNTPFTKETFKKTIQISGTDMSDIEIEQNWNISSLTIGGTYNLKRIWIEVLTSGISTFQKIYEKYP